MTPEVIAAVVSATAVSGAALVTAWMAVETRRTAIAAQQALELEKRPVLGTRGVDLHFRVPPPDSESGSGNANLPIVGLRAGVELVNAGRVPVRYRMKAMTVFVEGHATTDGHYASRGGLILPGSQTTFSHPWTPLDPPIASTPFTGRVTCEFNYSDDQGGLTSALRDSFEFTVTTLTDGKLRVEWVHADVESPDEPLGKDPLAPTPEETLLPETG